MRRDYSRGGSVQGYAEGGGLVPDGAATAEPGPPGYSLRDKDTLGELIKRHGSLKSHTPPWYDEVAPTLADAWTSLHGGDVDRGSLERTKDLVGRSPGSSPLQIGRGVDRTVGGYRRGDYPEMAGGALDVGLGLGGLGLGARGFRRPALLDLAAAAENNARLRPPRLPSDPDGELGFSMLPGGGNPIAGATGNAGAGLVPGAVERARLPRLPRDVDAGDPLAGAGANTRATGLPTGPEARAIALLKKENEDAAAEAALKARGSDGWPFNGMNGADPVTKRAVEAGRAADPARKAADEAAINTRADRERKADVTALPRPEGGRFGSYVKDIPVDKAAINQDLAAILKARKIVPGKDQLVSPSDFQSVLSQIADLYKDVPRRYLEGMVRDALGSTKALELPRPPNRPVKD